MYISFFLSIYCRFLTLDCLLTVSELYKRMHVIFLQSSFDHSLQVSSFCIGCSEDFGWSDWDYTRSDIEEIKRLPYYHYHSVASVEYTDCMFADRYKYRYTNRLIDR